MNRIAQAQPTVSTPGALLVDFDSVLGEDRKPFDATKLGTTVSATVTVRSIDVLAGGHARGIVDGEGGWAIFYVDREMLPRLNGALLTFGNVKIRGTHELVGMIPTIKIFAAREVSA